MSSVVDRIIKKFGTQERLAALVGTRQPVIAGWKRRGVIPVRQQPRVLKAAQENGIELTPQDFFETDAEAA